MRRWFEAADAAGLGAEHTAVRAWARNPAAQPESLLPGRRERLRR